MKRFLFLGVIAATRFTLTALGLMAMATCAPAQVRPVWTNRYDNNGVQISSDDKARKVVVGTNGEVYVTGEGGKKDIVTIRYSASGTQLWLAQYDGPDNSNDLPTDMAVDKDGNVFVTGQSHIALNYSDSLTIKYAPDGSMLWSDRFNIGSNVAAGANAIVLDQAGNAYVTGSAATIKYDSSGQRVWTAPLTNHGGGAMFSTSLYGQAIAVGRDGSVYITGVRHGADLSETVRFSPDGIEQWAAVERDIGGLSVFLDASDNVYTVGNGIIKYSPDGSQLWKLSSPGMSVGKLDASGNICVIGTPSTVPDHAWEWVISKYDTNGNQLWVKYYDGTNSTPSSGNHNVAIGLALDPAGNYYVTGTSTGISYHDYLTIKLAADGTERWYRRHYVQGSDDNIAWSIALDGATNAYVTGHIRQPMTDYDFLTLKYGPSGNLLWTNRYNGGAKGTHQPFALALDPSGNVLVAGSSSKTNADLDYVVLKYAANGTPLWTNRFDSGSNEVARGFAVDAMGNVVLTGTSETVKFGVDGALRWRAPYGGRGISTDSNGNVFVTGFSEVDFATARLDAITGTNVWTRFHDKIGQPDISQAIALDDDANVYVAGRETWMFVPHRTGGFRSDELVCVKYDASGQKLWAQPFLKLSAGFPGGGVKGIALDKSRRLLYVAANTWSIFETVQLTLDGQVNWATYQVPASSEGVTSIVLDHNGNVYLTGSWNYMTFKLSPDSSTNQGYVWKAEYAPTLGNHRANAIAVDSANNAYITGISLGAGTSSDFATVSYDPNGTQRWVKRWSSPGYATDEATGIAVDASGNVYVTGYSSAIYGSSEIVTIKYSPNPPPVVFKTDGSALLQLLRPAGQPYSVESSTNLSFWQSLGTATTDVSGLLIFEDTNAPAFSSRFYRTVSP